MFSQCLMMRICFAAFSDDVREFARRDLAISNFHNLNAQALRSAIIYEVTVKGWTFSKVVDCLTKIKKNTRIASKKTSQ